MTPRVRIPFAPAGSRSETRCLRVPERIARAVHNGRRFSEYYSEPIGVPVKKLQNDQSPDYAYGVALEDLALQQDIPTAMFAAKRLEVRTALHFAGQKWPIRVILAPLLAGCIALGCVFLLSRSVRRRSSSLPRS